MQTDMRYLAIDLKSFYASQECMDRGLDPLDTHLLVADDSRTEKTICLAVTPSLKACGIPGRPRLFEAMERIRALNVQRLAHAPGRKFRGSSCSARELAADPSLKLDLIIAPPRMSSYMAVSSQIYQIYLRHIAPEDIHVYSVDEVFIDTAPYLAHLGISARELASRLVREVYRETGITATAGIGSNLYLCKVALDILAKHSPPDAHGVRIAELDEEGYRRRLWDYQPLTDFWRLGPGYAKKLRSLGLCTMGDIARCSLGSAGEYYNAELLYRLFGINAELLIDHAWGWESCRIADIKAYRPENHSLHSGQVLSCPYPFEQALVIVQEMTELLVMDLLEKGLVSDHFTLHIGYDRESLTAPDIDYKGPISIDAYGRAVPRHAHGTARLPFPCCSVKRITEELSALFRRIVDPRLLIRRVNISAEQLLPESQAPQKQAFQQFDLFTDYEAQAREEKELELERQKQLAILHIRKKFGKNAILQGLNFREGATTRQRNCQVGGHRA